MFFGVPRTTSRRWRCGRIKGQIWMPPDQVNPEVVGEMLNFIYTGIRISNEDVLKEKAAELLGAANRYQLELLKSICDDKLCSSLNISNSIDYLIFGDMYKASKLRRIALRMVTNNMATLIGTK